MSKQDTHSRRLYFKNMGIHTFQYAKILHDAQYGGRLEHMLQYFAFMMYDVDFAAHAVISSLGFAREICRQRIGPATHGVPRTTPRGARAQYNTTRLPQTRPCAALRYGRARLNDTFADRIRHFPLKHASCRTRILILK